MTGSKLSKVQSFYKSQTQQQSQLPFSIRSVTQLLARIDEIKHIWSLIWIVKCRSNHFRFFFRRVASCISWDYFSQKGNCFPFPHSFLSIKVCRSELLFLLKQIKSPWKKIEICGTMIKLEMVVKEWFCKVKFLNWIIPSLKLMFQESLMASPQESEETRLTRYKDRDGYEE